MEKNKIIKPVEYKSHTSKFLIDKDQRIVAKNLRGERLAQVLDSLIQK